MPLLETIAGVGMGIQGAHGLLTRGKQRRDAKRSRRSALESIRAQRGRLSERHSDERLRMGEAQSGLEGGLAQDRLNKLGREHTYQMGQLDRAESGVKRAAKSGRRQAIMDILGDVTGVVGGASLGLSEILEAQKRAAMVQKATLRGLPGFMSATPYSAIAPFYKLARQGVISG